MLPIRNHTSAEGHLLYARSLELQDKSDAALYEYAALVAYYPGQEARYRYALLLKETGRCADARKFLEEICQAIDYGHATNIANSENGMTWRAAS